jgi:hypothetical protein
MGLNMFEWMFMGLMDVCGFGFSWVCFSCFNGCMGFNVSSWFQMDFIATCE